MNEEPDTKTQIDALLEAARHEGYAQGIKDARRGAILRASDELNKIINDVWRAHEECLQKWADDIGQTIHTAIPGRDVHPRKNADG